MQTVSAILAEIPRYIIDNVKFQRCQNDLQLSAAEVIESDCVAEDHRIQCGVVPRICQFKGRYVNNFGIVAYEAHLVLDDSVELYTCGTRPAVPKICIHDDSGAIVATVFA